MVSFNIYKNSANAKLKPKKNIIKSFIRMYLLHLLSQYLYFASLYLLHVESISFYTLISHSHRMYSMCCVRFVAQLLYCITISTKYVKSHGYGSAASEVFFVFLLNMHHGFALCKHFLHVFDNNNWYKLLEAQALSSIWKSSPKTLI